MYCNYCGKFVGHALWCRAPKNTAILTYGDAPVFITTPIAEQRKLFFISARGKNGKETTMEATKKAFKAALNRIEALEWLLEVEGITFSDMDAMNMEGFREFLEIKKKALRDAGREG